jgi:hypothetical protein
MRKNGHFSEFDDKKTEDFIWQKISEAADAYEAELNADPLLDDVCLTPEMMEDMMQRIAEEDEKNAESAEMLLSEDDREALELGRKTRARRKKSRKVLLRAGIAAAALAVVFGASMSIEANRIKLLNVWNFLQGKEAVIRVENDEETEKYGAEVDAACADILKKTGIHAAWFLHMPKGMQFSSYVVDETLGYTMMFYEYGDTIITVDMEKKSEQINKSQIFDGKVLGNSEIETKFGTVSIMEIASPEGEKDIVAQMVYDNCQYTIYGVLAKEELITMMGDINFY